MDMRSSQDKGLTVPLHGDKLLVSPSFYSLSLDIYLSSSCYSKNLKIGVFCSLGCQEDVLQCQTSHMETRMHHTGCPESWEGTCPWRHRERLASFGLLRKSQSECRWKGRFLDDGSFLKIIVALSLKQLWPTEVSMDSEQELGRSSAPSLSAQSLSWAISSIQGAVRIGRKIHTVCRVSVF
jgi:hypothetical protein